MIESRELRTLQGTGSHSMREGWSPLRRALGEAVLIESEKESVFIEPLRLVLATLPEGACL